MKEYELLRQKYTKHNESNFYNISNVNNNDISKDNDEPKDEQQMLEEELDTLKKK